MSEGKRLDQYVSQIAEGLGKSPKILAKLTEKIKVLEHDSDNSSFDFKVQDADFLLNGDDFQLIFNNPFNNRQIEQVYLVGYERNLGFNDLSLLTAVGYYNRKYAQETGNEAMKPTVFLKTSKNLGGQLLKDDVLDQVWKESEKLVVTKK